AMVRFELGAQGNLGEISLSRHEYDMGPLVEPSSLSASALKGRTVWVQRCALCHDGVGQPTYRTKGPWLDAVTVQDRGEQRVREKITTGSAGMPGFQFTLRPDQIDALLAFLKTVGPDQKPTPDQLASTPARPLPETPRRAASTPPNPSSFLIG